jgi:hypothetical protein
MSGIGGGARIGNRRSHCSTCNNFVQNVMRNTRKKLMERHQEEYQRIRLQVEIVLYEKVLADFREKHPPQEDL